MTNDKLENFNKVGDTVEEYKKRGILYLRRNIS